MEIEKLMNETLEKLEPAVIRGLAIVEETVRHTSPDCVQILVELPSSTSWVADEIARRLREANPVCTVTASQSGKLIRIQRQPSPASSTAGSFSIEQLLTEAANAVEPAVLAALESLKNALKNSCSEGRFDVRLDADVYVIHEAARRMQLTNPDWKIRVFDDCILADKLTTWGGE